MKVESLRPYQKKVNLTVKVVNVNDPREVTSKLDDSKHSVTEALVGDDTGTVLLTLWDDDISSVQTGQSYDIINGFTSLFKQSLRLNVGRYGELKTAEAPIDAINEANNLSGSEGESPKPAVAEEEALAVNEVSTEEATEVVTEETTEAVESSESQVEEVKDEGCNCSDCPGCGSETVEETITEDCECTECDECSDESIKETPTEEKKEESE